ncbi:MAG: hypothetical protein MJ252_07800 [archaeon]|nr:hypothetical protein [archaeon]
MKSYAFISFIIFLYSHLVKNEISSEYKFKNDPCLFEGYADEFKNIYGTGEYFNCLSSIKSKFKEKKEEDSFIYSKKKITITVKGKEYSMMNEYLHKYKNISSLNYYDLEIFTKKLFLTTFEDFQREIKDTSKYDLLPYYSAKLLFSLRLFLERKLKDKSKINSVNIKFPLISQRKIGIKKENILSTSSIINLVSIFILFILYIFLFILKRRISSYINKNFKEKEILSNEEKLSEIICNKNIYDKFLLNNSTWIKEQLRDNSYDLEKYKSMINYQIKNGNEEITKEIINCEKKRIINKTKTGINLIQIVLLFLIILLSSKEYILIKEIFQEERLSIIFKESYFLILIISFILEVFNFSFYFNVYLYYSPKIPTEESKRYLLMNYDEGEAK